MKLEIELANDHMETLLVKEGETAEMISHAFAVKYALTES